MSENIRDWIDEEKAAESPQRTRAIRHVSKHDPSPLKVASSFGPKRYPEVISGPKPAKQPVVPRRTDRPVYGLKSNKNHVTANAIEAILRTGKPCRQEPRRYRNKEDFGKVPEYLHKVKSQVAKEKAIIAEMQRKEEFDKLPPALRTVELEEAERFEVLEKLKGKWDETNRKYQLQTHHSKLDSRGKLQRKYDLEAELQEIETAIEKLSRGPLTLVADE